MKGWLIFFGWLSAYILVGLWVSVRIHFAVLDRSGRTTTTGDQDCGIWFGGIFWPFGIWYFVWCWMFDRAVKRRDKLQRRIEALEEAAIEREHLLAQAREELEKYPSMGDYTPVRKPKPIPYSRGL